jgi:predicted RNase H-like nuclease (RuvC/YqgF family)
MKTITVKKTEKYVTEKTFERAMASIAKSFTGVGEQLGRLESGMTTLQNMMTSYGNEVREHREKMSLLTQTDVTQERRIDNLTERVEKLERKTAKTR